MTLTHFAVCFKLCKIFKNTFHVFVMVAFKYNIYVCSTYQINILHMFLVFKLTLSSIWQHSLIGSCFRTACHSKLILISISIIPCLILYLLTSQPCSLVIQYACRFNLLIHLNWMNKICALRLKHITTPLMIIS